MALLTRVLGIDKHSHDTSQLCLLLASRWANACCASHVHAALNRSTVACNHVACSASGRSWSCKVSSMPEGITQNVDNFNGTFQIPVDSFNETSGGGRMVIATSNRYDSSPSTTNQRQNDEVYETP
jgi:hypothetical protein